MLAVRIDKTVLDGVDLSEYQTNNEFKSWGCGGVKKMSKTTKEIVKNLFINKPVDVSSLKKQRNMLLNETDRWTEEDHSEGDLDLYNQLIDFLDEIIDKEKLNGKNL
jgi:hypothetical protein